MNEIKEVIKKIIICEVIPYKVIIGKSREGKVKDVRNLIMKILHENYNKTYAEIGYFFNRSHATIISNVSHITDLIEVEPKINSKYNRYLRILGLETLIDIDYMINHYNKGSIQLYELNEMLKEHYKYLD